MRPAIPGILGAALVLLVATGSALAQSDYPSRLIRVVVAWPPGSGIDVLVRLMADPLRAELGQTLVIENKAGAAGVIGAEIAAAAPPDGYTLLFTSAALNMVAAIGTKTTYTVPDSFTPVANVVYAPMILVSPLSSNLRTPQDLIALAKSKPGELA
ncbi:MAG: tripartite tricarboxylate transporter substrate-binding protein, partial [Pseudomonadota bacterium]